LRSNPSSIDNTTLLEFKEFADFRKSRRITAERIEFSDPSQNLTPMEQIERALDQERLSLRSELLERLLQMAPSAFEQVVIDVLVGMGYGGSRTDAGKALGRSGDGGVDGVIFEDALGLDRIYVQAKRWHHNVSRPEVQGFCGAIEGMRSRKGIFITTSSFSKECHDYVKSISQSIVLIDGDHLCELMYTHNVGVRAQLKVESKSLDFEYFENL